MNALRGISRHWTLATALAAACLFAAGSARPAAAQEEKVITTTTLWWFYYGISPADISSVISTKGARLISLRVETVSPYRFSAVFVKNSGAYYKPFWWYYGLTLTQLQNQISSKNARLLDFQCYRVSSTSGDVRYAAILLPNTGVNAKSWWYYVNVDPTTLLGKVLNNKARLINVHQANTGGLFGFTSTNKYQAIMISNSGTDATSWWWYYNVTPDYIQTKVLEKDAQLISIAPNGAGRFSVCMVKRKAPKWWWYYGVSATYVYNKAVANNARLVHLEPYYVSGIKKYAAIMVQN